MTWRVACRNGTSHYLFFKYSKSRVAATCLPFSFPGNAASPMNWRPPFMLQYNYYNDNSQKMSKRISIQIDRKIHGTANWKDLLHIYVNDHKRFDDRNWASIMNKLKNFSERDAQVIQNDNRFGELIQNLEQAHVTGLQNFSPQSLSNILHALAEMKVRNEAILDLIENTSDWMYDDAKDYPQSLANIAWAYATLQYKAPKIFRIIKDMSSEIVQNGNGQDISSIAWACATLHYENLSFFGEMENHAERLLKNGTPQAISNTIWACATLHFDAPKLLNAIDLHSESIVGQLSAVDLHSDRIAKEGNPQGIANIAWAFAMLGYQPPSFFQHIAGQIERLRTDFNAQDITNLLWSLAILDMPDESSNLVLRHLWKHLDGLDAAEFSRENLCQLAQVSVYARLNGISLQRPPPELENLVATTIKAGEENQSSRFEDEYSKLLDQIGFQHDRNVSPFQDDRINFLDYRLCLPGTKNCH